MNAEILLVDDDPDDTMLLKEALISINKDCSILEAFDGREALSLLKEARDNNKLPNLVVLDISMPPPNGKELLAILKNDEKLKEMPIVVLTTSSNVSDIKYCKQFNVDLITKPSKLSFLNRTAQVLWSYASSNKL